VLRERNELHHSAALSCLPFGGMVRYPCIWPNSPTILADGIPNARDQAFHYLTKGRIGTEGTVYESARVVNIH